MNWATVRVLLIHELRTLVRDRRTVIMAIVLPLAIMPLAIIGTRKIQERRAARLERITYRYAIIGPEQDRLRALIGKGRRGVEAMAAAEKKKATSLAKFKSIEVRVEDPAAGLKSKKIHFYLDTFSGRLTDEQLPGEVPDEGTNRSLAQRRADSRLASEPVRLPGVPLARINYLGNDDDSQAGRSRMREFLQFARQEGRAALLEKQGFLLNPRDLLPVDEHSIAGAAQVTGSYVGRYLTVFLLMLMLSGGSVVAMDIIAGEKERGSLETLLTTAVRRGEVVAAKQLAILSVALVITLIQMANMLFYVHLKLIDLPEDFVIEVPPAMVVTLLLLFVPLAAFIASILLMLSAYAKSYKEAQLYFFPVYLISLVPALASVLPGISLRSAIVLVPLANVSVAVREVMVGKYDWPMILVSFGVMCITAAWGMKASAGMLSQERLITASEADAADLAGGPALFPKHVLRWYGVLGVILFAAALNVPQLGTFRRQLLFNELGLFLAGPMLMIRSYRLNVAEALALRPVKPAVWIAALLAIPAGNIVATGVFRLADLIFPVPKQVLEQFGRDVIPADVPLWQLVLFISILPGICEEIAFRGTLLYGLRRKLRPATLALTVGIIFGLFHVALFRIIPTGFLGVVLTAVALLTGSIFPCILIHAGNNAFGLWAAKTDFQISNLGWWAYLAASAVFALCFLVLYRNRTPYPDLRRQSN